LVKSEIQETFEKNFPTESLFLKFLWEKLADKETSLQIPGCDLPIESRVLAFLWELFDRMTQDFLIPGIFFPQKLTI
jgi:hypothetical protein